MIGPIILQIEQLEDETFQNIHRLQTLNIAYNRLSSVNFAAFDSIGTLSHLSIDLSHNRLQVRERPYLPQSSLSNMRSNVPWIYSLAWAKSTRPLLWFYLQALRVNRSNSYPILSNIMSLDLSYNNISMIEVGTLRTSRSSDGDYCKLVSIPGDLLRASGERPEGAEPLLEHHRGGFPGRRGPAQEASVHRHQQVWLHSRGLFAKKKC